jgi:hypothetical protein
MNVESAIGKLPALREAAARMRPSVDSGRRYHTNGTGLHDAWLSLLDHDACCLDQRGVSLDVTVKARLQIFCATNPQICSLLAYRFGGSRCSHLAQRGLQSVRMASACQPVP